MLRHLNIQPKAPRQLLAALTASGILFSWFSSQMDQPVWKWNKTVNMGVLLTRGLHEIERRMSFCFCFWVRPLSARWQCSFGLSFNQWHHWIFPTSFLILCASVRQKYHTDKTKKDNCDEEESVSQLLKWIFHLYQPCPLTPGSMFLPAGGCSSGCGAVIAEKLRKWMFYQPMLGKQGCGEGGETNI